MNISRRPTLVTSAVVVIHEVGTFPIQTRIRLTFVDVDLTEVSGESRCACAVKVVFERVTGAAVITSTEVWADALINCNNKPCCW